MTLDRYLEEMAKRTLDQKFLLLAEAQKDEDIDFVDYLRLEGICYGG